MNTEVVRDLLDRHTRLMAARKTHHVITELRGIGHSHDATFQLNLPGEPEQTSPLRVAVPSTRRNAVLALATVSF